MRDKIEMEEVFTENWEQLVDEIMSDMDMVWNEEAKKFEINWFF